MAGDVIQPTFHHVNLTTTRLQEMADFYGVLIGDRAWSTAWVDPAALAFDTIHAEATSGACAPQRASSVERVA